MNPEASDLIRAQGSHLDRQGIGLHDRPLLLALRGVKETQEVAQFVGQDATHSLGSSPQGSAGDAAGLHSKKDPVRDACRRETSGDARREAHGLALGAVDKVAAVEAGGEDQGWPLEIRREEAGQTTPRKELSHYKSGPVDIYLAEIDLAAESKSAAF